MLTHISLIINTMLLKKMFQKITKINILVRLVDQHLISCNWFWWNLCQVCTFSRQLGSIFLRVLWQGDMTQTSMRHEAQTTGPTTKMGETGR